MGRKSDLVGQKFGRLTVLREDGRIGRLVAWLCQCECGNTKRAPTQSLRNGSVRSCGCLTRERERKKPHLPYKEQKRRKVFINKAFAQGVPINDIAAELGLSPTGLITWLNRNMPRLKEKKEEKRKRIQERRANVVSLATQGMDRERIAKKTRFSMEQVRGILDRHKRKTAQVPS